MKHNYLKHLFTALLLLCTTIASAYDFEVGGIYYNILSEEDKTVEVINGTYRYTGDVVIPGSVTYNGDIYSVTSIGFQTFFRCTGLKSVLIGNGVKCIGQEAFAFCSDLKNITIPNSVTSIGYAAFGLCTSLTSLVIPNSVTNIGESAFSRCSGLTSIEIPNSVTSIGASVFYNCTGLTSIEIPNSVTSIGEGSFRGCTSLANLVIPNSVASIGRLAFEGCTSLSSIEIPNGVTRIEEGVFYSCAGLKSVTIPNSVTSIGTSAFYGCTGLTSLVIPNSVTSIESYAFQSCSTLTSIVIPDNVTSIGEYAFQLCSALTSIVIPNSITSIGSHMFYGCSSLANLVIPNSVTSIGTEAFYGTAWYDNQPDGVVYAGKVLYGYKGTMPANTSIVVKEGTLGIAGKAFAYRTGLTSVVIGNSVTTIGADAFYYCTGLTSIEIPNSVTSIGASAFFNCTALESITSLIPAEELFAIDSYVFYYVDKNACTLYVSYGAKETYAATKGWSGFTNIVELEPVTEITVTINEYGCATYCSQYALDFSEVEGLKAYSAIGYKPSTQTVTLARVMTTGAGQGIFIKGEQGEYTVPVIDNFDEYTLNLLVGTLEQTTVNSTDGEMSNYRFTIAEGDDAPKFYPFADNTTFSANRAYLQIPTAWLPATAQKSLNIRFDDGETTDIEELKGESGEVKTVYDLQGRVVENPTNGIYIVNGKKVIIK